MIVKQSFSVREEDKISFQKQDPKEDENREWRKLHDENSMICSVHLTLSGY
mgnify:CR=1 FL=1